MQFNRKPGKKIVYRKPPGYTGMYRMTNKLVDAGVTLGTVAIGASVVTGVVGALTKK